MQTLKSHFNEYSVSLEMDGCVCVCDLFAHSLRHIMSGAQMNNNMSGMNWLSSFSVFSIHFKRSVLLGAGVTDTTPKITSVCYLKWAVCLRQTH